VAAPAGSREAARQRTRQTNPRPKTAKEPSSAADTDGERADRGSKKRHRPYEHQRDSQPLRARHSDPSIDTFAHHRYATAPPVTSRVSQLAPCTASQETGDKGRIPTPSRTIKEQPRPEARDYTSRLRANKAPRLRATHLRLAAVGGNPSSHHLGLRGRASHPRPPSPTAADRPCNRHARHVAGGGLAYTPRYLSRITHEGLTRARHRGPDDEGPTAAHCARDYERSSHVGLPTHRALRTPSRESPSPFLAAPE
jgi:hypothetical protein